MNAERLPVIVAAADIESGVTSWALRFRDACRDHPRFCVQVLNCWRTGKEVGNFDAEITTEAEMRAYLAPLGEAIVIPNFVWELVPLCAERVAKGQRLHTLAYLHANSEPEYYAPARWLESLLGGFLTANRDIAANLRTMLPDRAGDIHVLPCGVEIPTVLERQWQHTPVRLIYAGRIVDHIKRVMDFVPLVRHLLEQGTDFRFTILGAGPQRDALKAALDGLPHAGRVSFRDSVPVAAMASVWREHDVFLQVSESEGTSCSMLEAMAQGCVPYVTNASSGVTDVIASGENGVVVPVRDMEALAREVHALSVAPGRMEKLGRAAHGSIERFGMPAYVAQFEAVVDTLMAHSPRAWAAGDTRRVRYQLGGGKGTPLAAQRRFLKRSFPQRLLARLYPA